MVAEVDGLAVGTVGASSGRDITQCSCFIFNYIICCFQLMIKMAKWYSSPTEPAGAAINQAHFLFSNQNIVSTTFSENIFNLKLRWLVMMMMSDRSPPKNQDKLL